MADATGKLPVLETVSKAFRYTADHIVLGIKLVWLWIPIVIVGMLFGILALGAAGGPFLSGTEPVPSGWNIALMIAGTFAYAAIFSAGMASIAVEWHRALLLGETVGWFHLKVRSRAFAYFGYFLAIGLVSAPIMLILMMASGLVPTEASDGPPLMRMLVLFGLVSVCWTLIFSRLFLVLPGAAVGDRRLSFRQSIALTKGNSLRIAGGFLLLTLIGLGMGLASLVLAAPMAGVPVVSTLVELAMFGLNIFLSFMGLSYMSFCYWFLVPAPEEGDLA